jgi:hypothetical protein
MRPVFFILPLTVLLIAACTRHTADRNKRLGAVDTARPRPFTDTPDLSGNDLLAADTGALLILVDSVGRIRIGSDSIRPAHLPGGIVDHMLDQLDKKGSLPGRIQLLYIGDVLMGMRGAMHDAIDSAQKMIRDSIAFRNYRRPYHTLTNAGKDHLKKQFPVLFNPVQ